MSVMNLASGSVIQSQAIRLKKMKYLLTIYERMNREFLIIRIPDKTSASVMTAF